MERPKQHFPANGVLLCGCASWRAYADARDACTRCTRRLEDLLHAVRELARIRGAADYSPFDGRTKRAIDFAFQMEPDTEDTENT